jgi:hypothetical protein
VLTFFSGRADEAPYQGSSQWRNVNVLLAAISAREGEMGSIDLLSSLNARSEGRKCFIQFKLESNPASATLAAPQTCMMPIRRLLTLAAGIAQMFTTSEQQRFRAN